jgi:CHAD domain-containing protein
MIEGGLSRIYRQGRAMGNMVLTMETDACEIHAFRKKAKYLQNQLVFLRTISRPFIKPMSSTLEKLTDHLGNYNDLDMACKRIEAFAKENDLPPKKQEAILHKLREEMQKALNQAIQAYKLIYVEKPKHFIHRISQYWQAYYAD